LGTLFTPLTSANSSIQVVCGCKPGWKYCQTLKWHWRQLMAEKRTFNSNFAFIFVQSINSIVNMPDCIIFKWTLTPGMVRQRNMRISSQVVVIIQLWLWKNEYSLQITFMLGWWPCMVHIPPDYLHVRVMTMYG
jgi:hypothetical protein